MTVRKDRNKFKLIFLFLLPFMLSCSRIMVVHVQYLNIDSKDNQLNLLFHFSLKNSGQTFPVYGIQIRDLETDSIIVQLKAKKENAINSYTYPSIPAGFKLLIPNDSSKLPILNRLHDYSFTFVGELGAMGFGEWVYRSFYSRPEARWLFDSTGHYFEDFKAEYQYWVNGNDKIEVTFGIKALISSNTFILTDDKNDTLGFKMKLTGKPVLRCYLELNRRFNKDAKIFLHFKNDLIFNRKRDGAIFLDYLIIVPDPKESGFNAL